MARSGMGLTARVLTKVQIVVAPLVTVTAAGVPLVQAALV